MMDRDKIIMVFYVDVEHVCRSEVMEYVGRVSEMCSGWFDESVKQIFIPVNGKTERVVECLNPKLADVDEKERIVALVADMETKYAELMSRICSE